MRLGGAAMLCLWALAPCGALGAEGDPAVTRWLCVDAGETALRCSVQSVTPVAVSRMEARTPAARAPALVRDVRQRPASWRHRAVLIPLFTHALDPAHVRELAQAVLCGPRSDCVAQLAVPGAAGVTDWVAFADANDPLLADSSPDRVAP